MATSVPSPTKLGLVRTLEFTKAPLGKTFYYAKRKNEDHGGHLPAIESEWEDTYRFRKLLGPKIYAVTNCDGTIRYIGKSWENYLYQRWIRPTPNIHHRESRDRIISELRLGRTPLHLWSATADELKLKIPHHHTMPDKQFVQALEGLWISRWIDQLWNHKQETIVPGFTDREYWLSSSKTDA